MEKNNLDMELVSNVEEYIKGFSADVQGILNKIRTLAKKASPKASEKISYGMPTLYDNGNIIHFAAYKNHIGLYPTPSGIVAFKKELSPYEGAKGSVRFPLDKPMPYSLINKIIRYRVKEHEAKIRK